jgi:hypothetical protein
MHPLHLAVENHRIGMVHLLENLGADKEVQNKVSLGRAGVASFVD